MDSVDVNIEELFSDDISDIPSIITDETNSHSKGNKDNNLTSDNSAKNGDKKKENEKENENEKHNYSSDVEAELGLNSPSEIIDREIEKLERYIIKTQGGPISNFNDNSIISISSTSYSQLSFSQNENNKRESIGSSNNGLIKKLRNEDDLLIEIVVNNKNKKNANKSENETTSVIPMKNIDKQEAPEPKKVVRKRGRPRKKKNENSKNNEKGKQQVYQSTPKKTGISFMELDDDDNDDIIPTAEELFDKSFYEFSQKNNDKKDNTDNVKNQSPFEIIESIFSSSDDDDIYMDKTLKIPGEGVLAYYKYDRRYHPAKILSYVKSNKTYKLLFWTGYKLTLKRNQFYTKYQPEFLTVELGEQRSEKDDVELNHFDDDELNDYMKEFIPKAPEFLKQYSWRYKDFINLELNSIKTHKELIKNSCFGYLSNTEIEYTIDQFKLALAHKSLVLDDLPITINISEDILMKSKEALSQDTGDNKDNNNNYSDNDQPVTRRKKKKVIYGNVDRESENQ